MLAKICGLTDVKETEYVNGRADFIGMVLFFPKSKRNITIAQAKEIMAKLDKNIRRVAVVVSPTKEQALEICGAGFDVLQVHGALTDEVYEAITIDIWKAFNIKDMDQYENFKNLEKIKGFVFDSAEPGSGVAYDHEVLEAIERVPEKLFILAGGLNATNVRDAIVAVGPDVVDVSSGVEYEDKGGKDPVKVDEFLSSVHC